MLKAELWTIHKLHLSLRRACKTRRYRVTHVAAHVYVCRTHCTHAGPYAANLKLVSFPDLWYGMRNQWSWNTTGLEQYPPIVSVSDKSFLNDIFLKIGEFSPTEPLLIIESYWWVTQAHDCP